MKRSDARAGAVSVVDFLDDNFNKDDQKAVLTAALRLLKEEGSETVLPEQLELDYASDEAGDEAGDEA